VVRGLGELLVTVGLVLLLFCVYELVWTNVEANRRQDAVAERLADDWRKPGPTAEP
jgi:sortase A